jgi:hypothetical protein
MLHRIDDAGLIVITQPAHAWISGQLAACWGSAELGLSAPGRELRLAAEQHDIAWLDWEAQPSLNPRTGLPYAFNELPTREHLEVWSAATRRALIYGVYPALLVSMHGTYLYERFHDFDADSDEDARAARAFLDREHAFQGAAIAGLTGSRDLSREEVERDRRLVSLWDAMSLALCMGVNRSRTFERVPGSATDIAIGFAANRGLSGAVECSPWPFRAERVVVGCEARRLDGHFRDNASLQAGLRSAPRVQLEFELVPG